MYDRSYIVSEQFLHDDLLARAQKVAAKVPELWRQDQEIEPALLTWAGESIPTVDGGHVEDLCVLPLFNVPKEDWNKRIKQMVVLTKAVGLVLIMQHSEEVRVSFETNRGSHTWAFPIHRHGDTRVLGNPAQTVDGEVLGLLWRRRQKTQG